MTIQRKGEEIMGWTSYEATYFKKNGDIDRKAECDAYFMRDNAGHYKVLKSSMKGLLPNISEKMKMGKACMSRFQKINKKYGQLYS